MLDEPADSALAGPGRGMTKRFGGAAAGFAAATEARGSGGRARARSKKGVAGSPKKRKVR
jgi:hypothetical protein